MNRSASSPVFTGVLFTAAAFYPSLLAVLVWCIGTFPRSISLWEPWQDAAIRYSATLSLVSSLTAAVLALAVTIPCGYVLSRYEFPGKRLLDILLYLPIITPGLVIGVSLLIFFQTGPGKFIEHHIAVFTFSRAGIVLAQTLVASAFCVRLVKLAFDRASARRARIAETLGATRWQAFRYIEFAEARSGLVEAFVLGWAAALGSFGPVILFCGTTRMRTEVLSTSIFLEFSVGNLERALVLSIWMGALGAVVLIITRLLGGKPLW